MQACGFARPEEEAYAPRHVARGSIVHMKYFRPIQSKCTGVSLMGRRAAAQKHFQLDQSEVPSATHIAF